MPANFRLQAVLDIRQHAEDEHKQRFAAASAHRAEMEARHAELEKAVVAATARVAEEHVAQRTRPLPTRVEDGLAQSQYLQRLRAAVELAHQAADTFRDRELAQAIADEDAARLAYTEARKDLEAIVKIRDREAAERRKHADERAEDAASDLAQAAYAKKMGRE